MLMGMCYFVSEKLRIRSLQSGCLAWPVLRHIEVSFAQCHAYNSRDSGMPFRRSSIPRPEQKRLLAQNKRQDEIAAHLCLLSRGRGGERRAAIIDSHRQVDETSCNVLRVIGSLNID